MRPRMAKASLRDVRKADTWLEAVGDDADFPQVFVRAVIYRLGAALVFDRRDVGYFESGVTLAERLTE